MNKIGHGRLTATWPIFYFMPEILSLYIYKTKDKYHEFYYTYIFLMNRGATRNFYEKMSDDHLITS